MCGKTTLAMKHSSIESCSSFLAIPLEHLLNFDSRKRTNNFKLYVCCVFIMDNCEKLILGYLGIVKSVVDYEDLLKNNSREMLLQYQTSKLSIRI